MINEINNDTEQEEALIREWIGKNNQDFYINKINSGGFSFMAFLFPEIMMLGRKMWLESSLLIIFELLILYFVGPNLVTTNHYPFVSFPPFILIKFILGFTYFKLYGLSIKRKIEKYKKQGLNYEQQLEKAKKLGGDIIIGVTIGFIVVWFVTFMTFFEENKYDYNDYNNYNNYNNVNMEISDNYDYEIKNKINSNYNKDDVDNKDNKEDEVISFPDIINQGEYGILEINEYKIKYDLLKWVQTEKDDISENEVKKILVNNNEDCLMYVDEQDCSGNLNDEEFMELFTKSLKEHLEAALNYTDNEQQVLNVTKNENGLYLIKYDFEQSYCFTICRQLNENEIQCLTFACVNLKDKKLSEKTIEDVEDLLFNIDFN